MMFLSTYNIPYSASIVGIRAILAPCSWNEAMVLQAFLCFIMTNFKNNDVNSADLRYYDDGFLKSKNTVLYETLEQNPNTFSSILVEEKWRSSIPQNEDQSTQLPQCYSQKKSQRPLRSSQQAPMERWCLLSFEGRMVVMAGRTFTRCWAECIKGKNPGDLVFTWKNGRPAKRLSEVLGPPCCESVNIKVLLAQFSGGNGGFENPDSGLVWTVDVARRIFRV